MEIKKREKKYNNNKKKTKKVEPPTQQTLLEALQQPKQEQRKKRTVLSIGDKKLLLHAVKHSGLSCEVLASHYELLVNDHCAGLYHNGKRLCVQLTDDNQKRKKVAKKTKLESEMIKWIEKARSAKVSLSVSQLAITMGAQKIRKKLLLPDSPKLMTLNVAS